MMMSLSLGISYLALLTPPSRTNTRYSVSSGSSQIWQQKNLSGFSSRNWPNSRGGNSTSKGSLSAKYVANEGELAEEGFDYHGQVGHRGPGSRAPPRRTDGKFWRRFPGSAQGAEDVTVPAEALRRGAIFRGIVSSVQPFGAFVTFGAFADGLIHISKLGSGYVKDVNDVVELGQEVMVRILSVEEATGRISLAVVEQEEIDRRKPYVSPEREETRRRARFEAGSGRSPAFSTRRREERSSRGAYAVSSRSMEFREGGERPRFTLSDPREEEQERVPGVPYASSSQREPRRGGSGGGEELTRFQQGSGRRSPFMVKEEENNVRNSFASTRAGKAGEEDRMSRNPFASPRQRVDGEEDRLPSNSFASSKQREARGGERMSRNPFASSRESEDREEDSMSRNPFASQGQREAKEDDRMLRHLFASSRQSEAGEEGRMSRNSSALSQGRREAKEDDRMLRNLFASSRQSEAGEEGRMSRNSSALSRQRETREEGGSPRFQQGHDGKLLSRGGLTRVKSGADGEQQTSPKMKLVDVFSDEGVEDKAVDGKVSSRMRNVMRGWYECDCC